VEQEEEEEEEEGDGSGLWGGVGKKRAVDVRAGARGQGFRRGGEGGREDFPQTNTVRVRGGD
jgi:hypothetical protein